MFLAFLGLHSLLPLPARIDELLRIIVLAVVLLVVSRPVIDLRATNVLGSAVLGFAIFLLWILPDTLFPGYRQSIIFENAITGKFASSLPVSTLVDPWCWRCAACVRSPSCRLSRSCSGAAWLMRWLIDPDFEKVPLGTYSAQAFWIVAVLFASEHGPYWDVGLAAGICTTGGWCAPGAWAT